MKIDKKYIKKLLDRKEKTLYTYILYIIVLDKRKEKKVDFFFCYLIKLCEKQFECKCIYYKRLGMNTFIEIMYTSLSCQVLIQYC